MLPHSDTALRHGPKAEPATTQGAGTGEPATPLGAGTGEPIEILALLDDPRLFGADPCPDLDAEACYRIGWGYSREHGTEYPQWDEAMPYLLRACELGSAFACSYLGLLHRFGVMAERDDLTALAFYERSCELFQERIGCRNAGDLRFGGDEVPEADKARGLRWYEVGCEAGDATCCYNRGVLSYGIDAQRSWYQRACDLGDPEGCSYVTGRKPLDRSPNQEPAASLGSESPEPVAPLAPLDLDDPDGQDEPSAPDTQDSR